MFKLTIEDDEGKTTVVPLARDEITIGRLEGNTIRLTERNVSRRHARLRPSERRALHRGSRELHRRARQRHEDRGGDAAARGRRGPDRRLSHRAARRAGRSRDHGSVLRSAIGRRCRACPRWPRRWARWAVRSRFRRAPRSAAMAAQPAASRHRAGRIPAVTADGIPPPRRRCSTGPSRGIDARADARPDAARVAAGADPAPRAQPSRRSPWCRSRAGRRSRWRRPTAAAAGGAPPVRLPPAPAAPRLQPTGRPGRAGARPRGARPRSSRPCPRFRRRSRRSRYARSAIRSPIGRRAPRRAPVRADDRSRGEGVRAGSRLAGDRPDGRERHRPRPPIDLAPSRQDRARRRPLHDRRPAERKRRSRQRRGLRADRAATPATSSSSGTSSCGSSVRSRTSSSKPQSRGAAAMPVKIALGAGVGSRWWSLVGGACWRRTREPAEAPPAVASRRRPRRRRGRPRRRPSRPVAAPTPTRSPPPSDDARDPRRGQAGGGRRGLGEARAPRWTRWDRRSPIRSLRRDAPALRRRVDTERQGAMLFAEFDEAAKAKNYSEAMARYDQIPPTASTSAAPRRATTRRERCWWPSTCPPPRRRGPPAAAPR